MPKQRTTDAERDAAASTDALAFRAAVRDVKPLAQRPAPTGLVKPPPRAALAVSIARVSPRARRRAPTEPPENLDAVMPLVDPLDLAGGSTPAISGGDALTFQRAGVRTQVVRRLRRGLFPIEDELDLHGLTQTAARDRLARFLTISRDAGRRCVRIIHGKGYRSGVRGPILKLAVDLWLRRHLDVMAFTSARPIDGGTGAVYVLLRA